MPDYRDPSPDAGHEAIRKPLADAIDALADHAQRIDDALLLAWATSHFAEVTLTTVGAAQAALASLQADLAALTDRVAALEQPPTPA